MGHIMLLIPLAVKYIENCTTFDIQKCTTLRSKMMLNLFRTQIPEQNVQSGHVLHSKDSFRAGI